MLGSEEELKDKTLPVWKPEPFKMQHCSVTQAKDPLTTGWITNTHNIVVNHGNKGEHRKVKNSSRKKQVHFH